MVSSCFLCFLYNFIVISTQQAYLTSGLIRLLGVNYGTVADNLPSPAEVVNIYKKYGVQRMRIFEPNHDILQALEGSGIDVIVGTRNEDLPKLAGDINFAKNWVQTNVVPYVKVIYTITAGNEAIPGEFSQYVAPAMANIQKALEAVYMGNLGVSTVVNTAILGTSYPPSQGAFSDQVLNDMKAVLQQLYNQNIYVNLYPYFAYASDPAHVLLDYALFTATTPPVTDGNLSYWSLFDEQLDAFFAAMETAGSPNTGIVVSESGWPSAGNGNFTTPSLAQTYNTNLRGRIEKLGGTPRRDEPYMEAYIFAMFNEDLKQEGIERNWGLLYPDGTPVYPFF